MQTSSRMMVNIGVNIVLLFVMWRFCQKVGLLIAMLSGRDGGMGTCEFGETGGYWGVEAEMPIGALPPVPFLAFATSRALLSLLPHVPFFTPLHSLGTILGSSCCNF